MTAKGIKKSYIKHHLKHPTFIKALRGVGRIQDIQIDKSRRENRDDKENRTVAVRHETIHFTGWYIDASVRTLQNRRMTLLRITMIDVVTFLAQFIILYAGLSNKDVNSTLLFFLSLFTRI